MFFKILGTAAGGGFPQWNCACVGCNDARAGKVAKRHHACAAISADRQNWTLVNAPPDIAAQIEQFSELNPGPAPRETKLRSVILTDAEMDHTIGLLVLREQSNLQVYATECVRKTLHNEFPIDVLLRNYASMTWSTIRCDECFDIENGAISITPFVAGHKKPRYVKADGKASSDWVIGLTIRDNVSGSSVVYAPAVEAWSSGLASVLEASTVAFIDGTFWIEDEMSQLGISKRTATECGHVPLSGANGLIECVSSLRKKPHVHLVHINNTNPLLMQNHQCTLPEGISLASDGMLIEV